MKNPLSLLASLFAAGTLAACAGYQPPPPAIHQALYQPYVMGAGDTLRITVFDQESLSNTYSVNQAGYISFPLIGPVPARGNTSTQIEKQIASKLQKGFLRDPDVTVEVERYRPIFVMGEVGNPGQYSYVPGLTIQKAIAAAGGFTPRANQRSVDVTREINGEVLTGRVVISDPMLPGDTVYVRERLF